MFEHYLCQRAGIKVIRSIPVLPCVSMRAFRAAVSAAGIHPEMHHLQRWHSAADEVKEEG